MGRLKAALDILLLVVKPMSFCSSKFANILALSFF